jgi:hypothetical protein
MGRITEPRFWDDLGYGFIGNSPVTVNTEDRENGLGYGIESSPGFEVVPGTALHFGNVRGLPFAGRERRRGMRPDNIFW